MDLPGRLVLLGTHVERSLSPRMQNAALVAAGIPLRYEPLPVTAGELDRCMEALVGSRAAGNVTIPHKERVAALCGELTTVAQRVGAVNTFWTKGSRLVGDNTDVAGFQALAQRVRAELPADSVVAVLGAGGAAAAVLVALSDWPRVRIRLYSRTAERARSLVDRLSVTAEVTRDVTEAVADAALVINSTPVGSTSDEHPVALDLLRSDAALLDLVYRRDQTSWVRAARATGRTAADGLAMLVEQGAAAFERWFGRAADRGAMWRAVR